MSWRTLALFLSGALLAACSAAPPVPATPSRTSPPAPVESNLPAEGIYVLPEAIGWNAAALDDFIAYAASQNSTGLIILDHDRIIVERYWPAPEGDAMFALFVHGTSPDGALLEDVASMQKSIIALLAGIAIDKGLLDISRPVTDYIGPGWTNAAPEAEAEITVRQLFEMNSGLTAKLEIEAPAGTKFYYNTPAYAKLQAVLEAAAGAPVDALTRDWLTGPLGLTDTGWLPRPAAFGNVGNPMAYVTTPRDLSRIGQMVLDGGLAPDRQRVIPEAQLSAMFTPTETNPAYGRLWWLNGGAWSIAADSVRREGAFIPDAPADLIAGLGALNRQLFIVPSRGLVVVRMGAATPDTDFTQQVWARLAPAMPE
jgi:CubicO group peptidase (beta-lactamase class C family)